MKKRISALLLALSMCVSLVVTASADWYDPDFGPQPGDPPSQGGEIDPPPATDQKDTSSGGSNRVSETNSITLPTDLVGGTVTVRPTSASKGVKVTITVTPKPGYTVGSVTVTDKDGNRITVTNEGNNKYSFIMPGTAVTIDVEFVRGQGAGVFSDVAASAYYYDAVMWAVERGITAGTTATTFSPNDPCTRAQIVTFLWRAAGSPKASADSSFTDVAAGTYYYDAVAWAVANGITAGTTDTTFSPNATCTRGQAVSFLYRAAGSPEASGDNAFGDVASGAYYANAVQWAVQKGVTAGTSTVTFSPNDNCTRAQIVTFLYRDRA